jgi:hypothetical protein
VVVDRGVLAGQADAGPYLLWMLADIDPGDAGPAGVGWEQGGQDADEGGLAGAVGAEQAEDAAGRHGQRQAVERPDPAPEHLDQTPDLDDGIVLRASSGLCTLTCIFLS